MKKDVALILVALSFVSCEKIFFNSDPPDTPERNFEMLWTDYDHYYSFFNLKNLNWDSIYKVKEPLIDDAITQKQLFDILSEMTQYLKDGHADLCSPSLGCNRFDFTKGYPVNRLNSISSYVKLTPRGKSLAYGIIEPDIGYINIKTFGGSDSDFKVIDDILTLLKEKNLKGIIVDIRGNGGGSDANSGLIANRFADQARVYSYVRYKSGPGHDEFNKWNPKSIVPDGERYLNQVILLTNRQVYSSAEDFVLAMQVIPAVTILGDTTGGGSGNPITRVLPNGWTFRVPRWQQVDINKNYYEGKGIAPEIPVWISVSDLANNRDTILEKAIEELRK